MRTDKQNNTGRYGLWRLARYARYAVPSLSIGFILTILTVVFDLLGPYIVSLLIDGEIGRASCRERV